MLGRNKTKSKPSQPEPVAAVPTDAGAQPFDIGFGMVVMAEGQAAARLRDLLQLEQMSVPVHGTDISEAIRTHMAPHHENHNRLDWLQARAEEGSVIRCGADGPGKFTVYCKADVYRGATLRDAIDNGRNKVGSALHVDDVTEL